MKILLSSTSSLGSLLSSLLLVVVTTFVWSTTPVLAQQQDDLDCSSITSTICNSTDHTTLCELLELVNIAPILDDDDDGQSFTVFAPIDTAFDELDIQLVDLLVNESDLLTEVLSYHVTGQLLPSSELQCSAPDNLVTMLSDENSRTLCDTRQGIIYQKGTANTDDKLPQVIVADIEACNGIVHVVDTVLLPKFVEELDLVPAPTTPAPVIADETTTEAPVVAPTGVAPVGIFPVAIEPPVASPTTPTSSSSSSCQSIVDIACSIDDFSTLCSLLGQYDLADTLADNTANYTVFAPTNGAFEMIEATLSELDDDTVTDVLLFHVVVDDVLFSDDLICSGLIEMANGKNSRTKCDGDDSLPTIQSGGDNIDGLEPTFVDVDIVTCNGIIHVVDQVMLPSGTLP